MPFQDIASSFTSKQDLRGGELAFPYSQTVPSPSPSL